MDNVNNFRFPNGTRFALFDKVEAIERISTVSQHVHFPVYLEKNTKIEILQNGGPKGQFYVVKIDVLDTVFSYADSVKREYIIAVKNLHEVQKKDLPKEDLKHELIVEDQRVSQYEVCMSWLVRS